MNPLSVTRAVRARIDGAIKRLGARSDLFASFYYLLFSRAFSREHRAALVGRLRYAEDLKQPQAGSPLLRRNIHRLEKGLLMVPRRGLFAVDYVPTTVEVFGRRVRALGSSALTDPEIRWAHGVLCAYFDATERNARTDAARELFARVSDDLNHPGPPLVPYRRSIEQNPPVPHDELLALARRRKSVRWFLQKPVPRELVKQAMEVAAEAPSACNRQPFVFRVLDDKDLLQEVARIPMGTAGYAHNIPMLVVVVGQLRNYFSERDRHLIYIDASLAAMGFALALETLGLSSCFVNAPDIEQSDAAMARALRLDGDERPIVCMAVGYPDPDGLVAHSYRKPIAQLLRFNRQ